LLNQSISGMSVLTVALCARLSWLLVIKQTRTMSAYRAVSPYTFSLQFFMKYVEFTVFVVEDPRATGTAVLANS